MKVLVACEESQRVCTAFRERGHEAFSCDILECSGGHPEWHIQGDVIRIINGNITFVTSDYKIHTIRTKWDLIIAHPPCTYLSNAGTRHFSLKCNSEEKVKARIQQREKAYEFFMKIINADCEKIVVENPVGYINSHYRKPDQIVHPYYFAKDESDKDNYCLKRTCLWIKGVEKLNINKNIVKPKPVKFSTGNKTFLKPLNWCECVSGSYEERQRNRSKTFPGIAKAMAEQWG